MRKYLMALTVLALSAGITGCGGGGGGSVTSSTSTTVSGGVYSSYVANAEVCLEDSSGNVVKDSSGNEICTTTDSNGVFQMKLSFQISDNNRIGLYVKMADGSMVKVADAPVVQLKLSNANTYALTPLSLADNSEELADAIGGALHAMCGDTTGDATVVDLKGIEVTEIDTVASDGTVTPVQLSDSLSLEEMLKEKKHLLLKLYNSQTGETYQVDINPENATAPVCIIMNGKEETVSYSCQKHKEEIEEHLKELMGIVENNNDLFLQAKTAAILYSLSDYLNYISTLSSLTDTVKQEITDVENAVSSLITSINANGLTQENRDALSSLISQLQTLEGDLNALNVNQEVVDHFDEKIYHLEKIVTGSVNVEAYHHSETEMMAGEASNHTETEGHHTEVETTSETSTQTETTTTNNETFSETAAETATSTTP